METQRLYWDDAYLTTFTARVLARAERGGRTALALDRTAFYAEGGGQPADHGTLNGVAVLDVQAEDGLLWHTLAAPLVASLDAAEVTGAIDWARRFDHMQQHHGQHLLSAAWERLYDLPTVSFHLSASSVTIDLSAPSLSAEQVAAVEELTNSVIWEDRPVLARFVAPADLATIALRKPPQVAGPVRVVSVPDFDHSACGGTHPRSTGGVGMVHMRRWERRGETVRVEFVCGRRALHDLRAKNSLIGRLTGNLSTGMEQLEGVIERLRANEQQAQKQISALTEHVLQAEAQQLSQSAESINGRRVVARLWAERSVDELRTLARALAETGCVALLALRESKGHLLIAAPPDGVDCATLLREVVTPFGGRGGGQRTFAQGGLPDPAQLEAVLAAAKARLQEL